MSSPKTPDPANAFLDACRGLLAEEAVLREGGGPSGLERQHKLGRLFARERIAALLDNGADFLELGLWAAHGMYREWGAFTAAGVVTGIGRVAGRSVMVVANDATVKAGAFVPMTCKKVLRAQRIAFACGLPLVYLVDSSGVFLPMQDEIFPDEDDFGRIFRNNAVLSAAGLPQFAAIMGNCVAGGAYLPVLCDKVLMTEGSGLYLAGPSLVKAAIGQDVDSEALGGAAMHAEISGTVDFREKDDAACLARLRSLVALLPADAGAPPAGDPGPTERPAADLYQLVGLDGRRDYDARDILRCIVDAGTIDEYKADYGGTWSAPMRGWAGGRSASSPTSGSGCTPRRRACRSAGSSTRTAPTRPRASSWTATRPGCRSSSSRTCPGSWWARMPSRAASSAAERSS